MKPSSAVILLLSLLGPSAVLGAPQNYDAAPTSTLDSAASSTAAGSAPAYTLPDQSPGAMPTPPPEVYYPENGNGSHPEHHGNGTHPHHHHHHHNGTYADYEHHNGTHAQRVNGTEFEYAHHNGTHEHHKNGTELEHHHHLHNGSKPMNFTGAGEDPSGADAYPTPY